MIYFCKYWVPMGYSTGKQNEGLGIAVLILCKTCKVLRNSPFIVLQSIQRTQEGWWVGKQV